MGRRGPVRFGARLAALTAAVTAVVLSGAPAAFADPGGSIDAMTPAGGRLGIVFSAQDIPAGQSIDTSSVRYACPS